MPLTGTGGASGPQSAPAIRCGLVGAGNWMGSALLPALRAQPFTDVVGCVAGSIDEAGRFAAASGIAEAYPSVGALIARPGGLDVAVIATPDHVHARDVATLLEAGVAVYCEKPLANDGATARDLVALGTDAGVAATVGYSFRFNPAIQALKRDLESGRLGEPWLIELAEHNPQFHPAGGKPMNWKGDPDQAGGGALFEYGSHVVDMAAWLLGPIAQVTATLQRVLPGARLDDIATLQLRFASGASGTLISSWVLTGGFPGIRIVLHGSKGVGEVAVDDRIPGGQRYRFSPPIGGFGEDAVLPAMIECRSDAARRHIGDFLATVAGRQPLHAGTLPTLRQAAHVQDVLDAALAATEAWQAVPQPP